MEQTMNRSSYLMRINEKIDNIQLQLRKIQFIKCNSKENK